MIFENIDITFYMINDISYMAIMDKQSNSHYLVCGYPKSEKLYCLKEIEITLDKIKDNREKLKDA